MRTIVGGDTVSQEVQYSVTLSPAKGLEATDSVNKILRCAQNDKKTSLRYLATAHLISPTLQTFPARVAYRYP